MKLDHYVMLLCKGNIDAIGHIKMFSTLDLCLE